MLTTTCPKQFASAFVVFFFLFAQLSYGTDGCPGGRTQTPGGWGAPANGNNPGVYRDAHFDTAFPDGITLGCGGNTITFTSAAAIEAYLPCGGGSFTITGVSVDPSCSGNNLINHLLAATLSVGFDLNDPNFGSSNYNLQDLVINTGTFQGWTVGELLALANDVLGGCNTSYSPVSVKSGLAMINENYVDGNSNNGNLDCPEDDPCVDNQSPFVSVWVFDQDLDCSEVIDWSEPVFTDPDGDDLTVLYTESTEGTSCNLHITRTWVASDDCENAIPAVVVQNIYLNDTTPPVFTWTPDDVVVECSEALPNDMAQAEDTCNDISITWADDIIYGDCPSEYTIIRTFTAMDACGNTSYASQIIDVVDTTPPVLSDYPADAVLDCGAELPDVPEITALDACDGVVEVTFSETIGDGSGEDEGVILNCSLITPEDVVTPFAWSLVLFDFLNSSDTRYFTTLSGQLTVWEDQGSGQLAHITAHLVSMINPNAGFDLDLWLYNGESWLEWDAEAWVNNYKDDYNLAGLNYLDWTYFLIDPISTLTGWGDYAGSLLQLQHAPSSLYFGYQMGIAANNTGPNYGNGGWVFYNGVFVDSSQNIEAEVDAAGDLSFDQSCCNDPSVTYLWTAEDCAGNTTTHTQVISFASPDEEGIQGPPAPAMSVAILSVSPNPASSSSTVTFKSTINSVVRLMVIDAASMRSRLVFSGPVIGGLPVTKSLTVSSFTPGAYLLKLQSANGDYVTRTLIVE